MTAIAYLQAPTAIYMTAIAYLPHCYIHDCYSLSPPLLYT